MTEPIKAPPAPSATDLGVIVNDRQGEEKNFNIDEAVVPLRFPNEIFDRLVKAATFHKYPSVEAYCESRIVESLNAKVGAAHIDAPSSLSGVDAKKITGPSYSGMVRRG